MTDPNTLAFRWPLFETFGFGAYIRLVISDPDPDGTRTAHLGLQYETHQRIVGQTELARFHANSTADLYDSLLAESEKMSKNIQPIVDALRRLRDGAARMDKANTKRRG